VRREVYGLELQNPEAKTELVGPIFHVRKTIVLTLEAYAKLIEGRFTSQEYQELGDRLSAAAETEPAPGETRRPPPHTRRTPGPRGMGM
jgi:hypothetical protein